jgi:hypothetical protein
MFRAMGKKWKSEFPNPGTRGFVDTWWVLGAVIMLFVICVIATLFSAS